MSDKNDGMPGAEQWMSFWTNMMNGAMPFQQPASGSSSSFPGPTDAASQMRNAFLEAWGRQCEDYMRSDAFLGMMKKSMENSLAFRQKLNEFLQNGLHQGQAPSREDTGDILQFLHSFEERVLDQLDNLTSRVDALESRMEGTASKGKSKKGNAASGDKS